MGFYSGNVLFLHLINFSVLMIEELFGRMNEFFFAICGRCDVMLQLLRMFFFCFLLLAANEIYDRKRVNEWKLTANYQTILNCINDFASISYNIYFFFFPL